MENNISDRERLLKLIDGQPPKEVPAERTPSHAERTPSQGEGLELKQQPLLTPPPGTASGDLPDKALSALSNLKKKVVPAAMSKMDKLGLDNVGIKINSRGGLDTDGDCRVKGSIFAVGDVTQHSALYNVAEMEGRYAVKSMYLRNKYPLRYSNMSTIMFFNPEVAAVGLNEQTCQTNNIPYRVGYYSNSLLNRAIAMRRTDGFVKIIVSDDGQDRILGMRAAGPQASNTIIVIAHLMDQDKGVTDIMKSIHPHPSITEGIQECLRLLAGKSVFKPQVFPEAMRIRTWKPE